ncbi:hypothetical protein BJX62DRAFT_151703 [Aspergillus germanicus]
MVGTPRLLPLVPNALRPSTVVIAVQRPYRGRSPLAQGLPEILRPGSKVWCTCSSPHRSPLSPQSRPGRSSLPLPSPLHSPCWPRIASFLARGSFSDSNSLSFSTDRLSPPLFDSAALTFPPHIILPFAHHFPNVGCHAREIRNLARTLLCQPPSHALIVLRPIPRSVCFTLTSALSHCTPVAYFTRLRKYLGNSTSPCIGDFVAASSPA